MPNLSLLTPDIDASLLRGHNGQIKSYTDANKPTPAEHGVGPIWIDEQQLWSTGTTYRNGIEIVTSAYLGLKPNQTITTQLQQKLDELGHDTAIIFAPGYFYLDGEVNITSNFVHLNSVGQSATKLIYQPSADGSAINFSNGANILGGGSFRNILIQCNDTVYNKVALEVSDNSSFLCSHSNIRGFYGNSSVGVKYSGRESCVFEKMKIQADVPFYITKNPNTGATNDGWLTADHLRLIQLYLWPADAPTGPLPSASIYMGDACHISNMTIEGGVWARGQYGLYIDDSSTNLTSHNLSVKQVRREQPSNATGYSIYINKTPSGPLNFLDITDCYFAFDQNGLYLRNVDMCNLTSTNINTTTGVVINASQCEYMNWDNLRIDATADMSQFNMDMVDGSDIPIGYVYPRTAKFTISRSAFQQLPARIYNDVGTWSWKGQLANNAVIQIPVNSSKNVNVARVSVSCVAIDGTAVEGGDWVLSQHDAGNNGVTLISGSANCQSVNLTGNLCVYCNQAGLVAPVNVQNRLNTVCDLVIYVILN